MIKFYNIIIKSANVDKGGGGKTLIHKMWIKRRVFLTPLPNLPTHTVLDRYRKPKLKRLPILGFFIPVLVSLPFAQNFVHANEIWSNTLNI